ncbi:MAG: TfoX/Sxy family protein [Candidatus Marinimicrobia bacterium]|nr:TfoX/Sxy family protein [Candidatus Neomarinimicrobiota bacterium]
MAYDEGLAQRIRELLEGETEYVEKKMFGGVAFMVRGHMTCGVTGEDLMVRLADEEHAEALAQPHVRAMDFTGRPMKGFIYVDSEGTAEDEALGHWVGRALAYTRTRPPK